MVLVYKKKSCRFCWHTIHIVHLNQKIIRFKGFLLLQITLLPTIKQAKSSLPLFFNSFKHFYKYLKEEALIIFLPCSVENLNFYGSTLNVNDFCDKLYSYSRLL